MGITEAKSCASFSASERIEEVFHRLSEEVCKADPNERFGEFERDLPMFKMVYEKSKPKKITPLVEKSLKLNPLSSVGDRIDLHVLRQLYKPLDTEASLARRLIGKELVKEFLGAMRRFHVQSPYFDCEAAGLNPLRSVGYYDEVIEKLSGKSKLECEL